VVKTPRASLILLAAGATLCACSRDTPEQPGLGAITGHLALTGALVDGLGHYLGLRVVPDADGVPVDLVYGGRVQARTTTVDGLYRFGGLAAGGYTVRVQVGSALHDETSSLTLTAGRELVVRDTLRLVSRGDLFPSPNPVGDSTLIFFDVLQETAIDLSILDVAGHTVNNLITGTFPKGSQVVTWYGRDEEGSFVHDPLYWAVFSAPEFGDFRAQLLFR
jgi:hypothetical protein